MPVGDTGEATGQQTMANSEPVALASDQAAIPVTPSGGDLTSLVSVEGATSDAKVTGDNSGSISAKLRGLNYFLNLVTDTVSSLLHTNIKQIGGTAIDANSGTKSAGTQRIVVATDQPTPTNPFKVDPQGQTSTDIAVTTDANGSVTAYLRGLVKILNDVWDSTNHLFHFDLKQIAGGTAITGGVTGSVATGGNVAHGSSNSGNPDYAGGEAIAHGTNPTAVAAGQRTKWYGNRAGLPFVINGHPNTKTIEAAYTAAQTNVAVITVSAGTKIVVMKCSVLCSNANTVSPQCRVGFGTSTTPTTAGVILTHPGIAAGSGVVEGDGGSIIGVGADDEDVRITCDVPTTGSLRVLLVYFTIES